ncbi:MAG: hypothetical protein ACNA8L_00555 [Luteolibacter sp.]
MHTHSLTRPAAVLLIAFSILLPPIATAQDAAADPLTSLNQALAEAKDGSSDARKRLAVRRVIRDAETLVEAQKDAPARFPILEFLFRARQQLIALDNDAEHRKALLETCRELVKAPGDMATLRVEADLLLTQADLAKQGANATARANSLRPFVERYIDTAEGARVLRMAMVMALELGDSRVVTGLQEMIEENFAGDLAMIEFQRDKLGGQVFGAPFAGAFERSDGKIIRYPMDAFGRVMQCVFWSNNEEGLKFIKGLAAGDAETKNELGDRLEIVSFNLDDLPDAGESILRGLDVDWQALRLPGGRDNPIYKAYAQSDPKMLTVSPTGTSAMIMSGTERKRVDESGETDFARILGSSVAREWGDPRYLAQLLSLSAGDFLVIDPEGGINPVLPPELKATARDGSAKPLSLGTTSVPEETLRTIQKSIVAPSLRYRLTPTEALASYRKTADLCRMAIADHPAADNLWIVRNRLITALMGQWKTRADVTLLEAAVTEAQTAIEAGYPQGCDVIARFCLARGALLDPVADPQRILNDFIAESGGESAPGPALAAASLLALDIADRGSFKRLKKRILAEHTEHPAMWTYTAFLLDRYHDYWLFQVPFTAGWSFGRRQNYFMAKGDIEDASRMLQTELLTLDGKPLRIPADLDSEWTLIVFIQPGPWSTTRDDGLPPNPARIAAGATDFTASRPQGDFSVMLATLGGEPDAIRANLEALIDPKRKQSGVECPVLIVPNGVENPLIQRLGMLSEDKNVNGVLVRKGGRIALAMSGFIGNQDQRYISTPANVIAKADEDFITATLERGDVEAAKQRILTLAPPFDPNAVDEKGRKLKAPQYSLAHLRARARVYAALKEWDKALADAEEVVSRQLSTDGSMSLRTDELDASESLRDEIRTLANAKAE